MLINMLSHSSLQLFLFMPILFIIFSFLIAYMPYLKPIKGNQYAQYAFDQNKRISIACSYFLSHY